MQHINEDYIYNLFETSNIVQITESQELRRSDRFNIQPKQDASLFSPNAQIILNRLTPISRKRMIEDFNSDDLNLLKREAIQEEIDETFIYFENQEVGQFLESWICFNMRCPGCNGILYKYKNKNMPVVDVKCINKSHLIENGPKYFQIKATEKDTTFNGQKYFSLEQQYIKIGSTRYGQLSHEIKLGDDYNKKRILIGYICIEYYYISDSQRRINIDINRSFILIPNLNIQPQTLEDAELKYYTYINTIIPTITFNPSLFNIILFNQYPIEYHNIFKNINIDTHFVEKLYVDDIAQILFKKKYLKYKKKYIELKEFKN